MKLITRQSLANEAAAGWEKTYGKGQYGEDNANKTTLLKALGATPDPDEIDRIIGNDSWTRRDCDECKQDVPAVVQLGEEPDYETATACICLKCLKKAVAMATLYTP